MTKNGGRQLPPAHGWMACLARRVGLARLSPRVPIKRDNKSGVNMNVSFADRLILATVIGFAMPAISHGQIKPETARDFNCYIQAAEARMDARKTFLLAESDSNLDEQLVRDGRIQTVTPNGANPHKLAGGQLYDWIATMFIPGAGMERLVLMLQDYDRRPLYFPDTISTSQLLCRSGKDRFRYSMRLKEPAVLNVESDVTWERVDPHRWRVRSYSTNVQEVGKDHGYLRRLYSYWRFAETDKGVYVEGETITLSDEFSAMARAFGSAVMGMSAEKSLKHSLVEMRGAVLKPGVQITGPREDAPECPEPFRPAACTK